MPIKFPVSPGSILLCDYDTGFYPPEMVKKRPVVVISPRLPRRDGLCTVVPLSTTEPEHPVPYVCRLELPEPLPEPFSALVVWAKADMLATVGFHRLDLFRTGRDQYGKRKYLNPKMNVADMQRIRASVLHALGMSSLTSHLEQPTLQELAGG